jgi:hypothetical protein
MERKTFSVYVEFMDGACRYYPELKMPRVVDPIGINAPISPIGHLILDSYWNNKPNISIPLIHVREYRMEEVLIPIIQSSDKDFEKGD